jgi:restriction endonuclease-like protein
MATKMTPKDAILKQQKTWATGRGQAPSSQGYLPDLASNLFQPLSPAANSAFLQGNGGEIMDQPRRNGRPGRPAKMRALHSSAALAVNVFDYWTTREKAALAKSLGLKWKVMSIGFEARYGTGLPGIPPNLDLELGLADKSVVAVESKFTEWLTPRSKRLKPFKEKSYRNGTSHWAARQLPQCQELAEGLHAARVCYQYLDAEQLLKHALGLATQRGDKFSLLYLYFEFNGTAGAKHGAELSDFARRLDPHLHFRAMSYQQLFEGLKRFAGPDHGEYVGYLGERYFR